MREMVRWLAYSSIFGYRNSGESKRSQRKKKIYLGAALSNVPRASHNVHVAHRNSTEEGINNCHLVKFKSFRVWVMATLGSPGV